MTLPESISRLTLLRYLTNILLRVNTTKEERLIMKTIRIFCVLFLLTFSTAVIAEPNDLQHFDYNDEEIPSSLSMSVIVANLGGIEYVEGAEIACVTPAGVIAGATALYGDPNSQPLPPSWGFAVWGDENLTEDVVEGFVTGEELRFLYWDPVRDMELGISFEAQMGNGVFEENGLLVIDVAVSVESGEQSIPLQFALNGVYPNPFNSNAVINYSVAVSENVSVFLYDLSGRLVRELSSGIQSPGRHQCLIDGANFAAGVYLVSVKNSMQTQTQKVILLK